MKNNLSWRELKALNDLYINGFTRAKIQNHAYIQYLFRDRGLLDQKFGNANVLIATQNFEQFYEMQLKDNFSFYSSFFGSHGFLKPQSNYQERDIRVLMLIADKKKEILDSKYSRKKFSSLFFDDSKYLKQDSSLEKAVLSILELDAFQLNDPSDQQYRLVLDCKSPKLIVLCENIDFLLYPELARENNIWLWYIGGNNTKKLDHLPPVTLPIYYSCDWDYDGLKIYERIRDKIPAIELLYPNNPLLKPVDTYNHKSSWKSHMNVSKLNLNSDYYDKRSIQLIESLVAQDCWIEEESNDLIQMISDLSKPPQILVSSK